MIVNKKDILRYVDERLPQMSVISIALTITIGLYIIYKLICSGAVGIALAISTIPLLVVIFLLLTKYYHRIFYLLFASHFLILLASSFVDLKLGMVALTVSIAITLLIAIISFYKQTSWKEGSNGMLLIFSIWVVYCVIELINSNTVLTAWTAATPNYFILPILCAVLVPLSIRRYRSIEWLLLIWSIFIILAAFKGYWQKSHGFNARELKFLFEDGGAKTHIIWSGIRYFSFFTDAANYGVHMAMGALGFGISAYYTKPKFLKIYFTIIAMMGLYGMFISGTRAAIAVPIGGLMAFVVLSRNNRAFFIGLLAVITIFAFFKGTTVGNSNVYIYKMRSAFNPKKDASFQVRVENRELLKEYMKSRALGYGLGLGGGQSSRFKPKERPPVPPDSWLINVWAETGTIGFILYMILHMTLFAWCSWIIMFKITSQRLKRLLSVWICINVGFFIAAYANDVMQYPNVLLVYTGFALCFAGPAIEAKENKTTSLKNNE